MKKTFEVNVNTPFSDPKERCLAIGKSRGSRYFLQKPDKVQPSSSSALGHMPIQDYVVTIVFDRHVLVTIYINQLEHSENRCFPTNMISIHGSTTPIVVISLQEGSPEEEY